MSVAGFHSALTELANLKLTEQALMDSIFLLGEPDCAAFLRHMMQFFGCTYICLWSYSPLPYNCLKFSDGLFQEESSQQPSSSSGSLAMRLFNEYCGSENYFDHGCVPGIAFKNNLPFMEMTLDRLQRQASSEVQMQFYQEAGIKTAVFMGCATGEIELGWSSKPQVDLEMEMKNWFPVDFSRQTAPGELPQPTNLNRHSTSSSSLGSLSVDSIEYSHSLFNIPSASFVIEPSREALVGEALLQETLSSAPISAPISTSPHHQAIRALSQIRNNQLPTIESEDAAMTRAILAVLSSSSSSTSSSNVQQTAQNLPRPISPTSHKPTAFRSYDAALAPVAARTQKHNLFRRAVLFFRNLNMRRRQELQIQGNRPTNTQLHHMIAERRRREKLNESFQVLRSLLPPQSKKDKASVLSSTTDYLSALKSQVEELRKRNHILETQLLTIQRETGGEEIGVASSSERVNVEIAHVSTSTSEARSLDLRVSLRSGECSLSDLVIRILEFLKQQRNISVLSVQTNTRMVESTPVHGLVLRLKVEEDEFDESGFEEAVRRVVDDLPH